MRARFEQRIVWLETAVSFTITLLIYTLTLPPGLTWENFGVDGGELITAAMTLGVPHPPGYPTYVLLSKLFSLLPIGTVAFRFNLFSAVCMAAAASVITATANLQMRSHHTDWLGSRPIAVAVGLSVAFAPLVWSQAVIAEVYGLNMLVLALLLWALVGKRNAFLIGILFGLSLTTHLTSLFFAPLILLQTPRPTWHKLFGGMVVGLLPFLFIFLLARSDSPVTWGNASTIRGWWWLVSGQAYRGYLFALPPAQAGARLLAWGWALLNQLTLLGVPLLAVSGYAQWRSGEKGKKWVLGVLATAVPLSIYAFSYNTADAIVLLLPVILVSTLLLIPALQTVGKPALLLPLGLLLLNFNSQNLQKSDDFGRRGIDLLTALPPQTLVITPGDATIFTLWYVQHIEDVRPDIILVDSELFAFDWYRQQIQQAHPTLTAMSQNDPDIFAAANSSSQPICTVSLAEPTISEQIERCIQK